MIEAYPLAWPNGWKRANPHARDSSKFKSTFAVARDELLVEVERLRRSEYRPGEVILSTNVNLRQDGLPYANQREPVDPGVAIYFQYKKKPMVFACDKYRKVWENMVAIRKTIEAIRGMERWGASDMMERAFTGFTAIPDSSWPKVLGVARTASDEEVKLAYRRLCSQYHPDRGGDIEQFNRVQRAYDEFMGKDNDAL
jgi:hypothetical protein